MDINDVARTAGVSVTTVSRVINNVPSVKEEKRKRVLEAIKRLGYKPNIIARRLASKRHTNIISLIVPPFKDMFSSFFLPEVLKGISATASTIGLDLLFYITHEKRGEELFLADVLNPSVVGGILFADLDGNELLLDRLATEKIPFVVMNNYFETLPINCVGIDNKSAAVDAVDYLAKLGHRDIATITGNLKTQAGRKRLEGFRVGLRKNSISPGDDYIVEGDFTRESAQSGMKKLLRLKPGPTAVFVASDEMAQGAIETIFDAGLKVPGDISIVGFDDSYLATSGVIPLTTIHQPLAEMGKRAAEILYRIMTKQEKQPVRELLKARLTERHSCRRLS